MEEYLRKHIPEAAMKNRTRRENGRCFLEFGYPDEQLLSRLGINCDKLGPRMVACMWDEASSLAVGGYLVVDNLAMGSPSMGGIRMIADITPADIHNLARGMTVKIRPQRGRLWKPLEGDTLPCLLRGQGVELPLSC
jgi:glutamate dehydrogenase (NAD(P)+)